MNPPAQRWDRETASVAALAACVPVVWLVLLAGQTLYPGDRVRTGPRSRATLRWRDNSVVNLDEQTELELLQPPEKNLRLDDGTIKVFNRDGTTNIIRILTRQVVGGVTG